MKHLRRAIVIGQQGAALLEILFANFIVVTTLLGLSGMTVMVMQSNSSSDLRDTAINLAQDKLEELKNALFTSSVLADVNTSNNSDLESTSNVDYQVTNINELGKPGGIFTRTWNIADNTPKAGMKTLVVIVTWADRQGSHRVSFRTIL
jgi:Tfp pilus assembly protein PilV